MSHSDVVEIKPRSIGLSIPRVEDATILTGRGEYVADVRLPGLLHVAFLRSPFANAAIRSVDASAAEALPGVERVLTGADFAKTTPGIAAGRAGVAEFAATTQPLLAVGVARYQGEAVAMVVASERRIAEDALERIVVDYEERSPVRTIDEALKGTPTANEQVPGNLIFRNVHAEDDVEDAFSSAAAVAEGAFSNNRVSATPMETRGCVARYDWTNKKLTVWIASQMPAFMRTTIAMMLQIPEHAIEVMAPHVGGGFGQKAHVHPDEIAVCLGARELGQPLSWIEDRRENLLTATHAKDQRNRMGLAADSEGRLVAVRNHSITDSGAYNCLPWTAAIESDIGCMTLAGSYRVPRAACPPRER